MLLSSVAPSIVREGVGLKFRSESSVRLREKIRDLRFGLVKKSSTDDVEYVCSSIHLDDLQCPRVTLK
jgi:hypothetical protein